MKHKYLRELFPDSLPFPYDEEDYHGFDIRDTFDMDWSLAAWLYENLRYFQDVVTDQIVMDDPEWRTFEIDGEQLTQLQCINRMVEDCQMILLGDDVDEQDQREAAKNDLFNVLSKVYWAMWW